MDNKFYAYIIIIVLIGTLFITVASIALGKASKRKKAGKAANARKAANAPKAAKAGQIKPGGKPAPNVKRGKPVTSGYLSILFDRGRNVIFLPYVRDMSGYGRAVSDPLAPLMLNVPYESSKLGALARKGLKMCEGAIPGSDEELMQKLNFRNWKDFSEGKRCISVYHAAGDVIVLNTTTRNPDGVYQFNVNGREQVIRNDITDQEFGDMLLVMLQKCR